MPKLLKDNSFIVYKHTSPSGKVYIGITSNSIYRRWRNGYGYKECTFFYRAILKYGWENIKHEILYSNLPLEEACQKEKELIRYYKDLKISYNNSNGGETNAGYIPTEKQRKHAKNIWKNKKIPKEIVAKSALKRTGIKQSKEACLKKSIALQKHYAKKVYKINKLGQILQIYNNL